MRACFACCLIALMVLMAPTRLGAQDLRFDRLSLEEGLSQSTVYAIVQDRRGFMWFGTEDGLNRYDGYHFKVYRHEPEHPQSLSNNTVYTLYEDRAGVLWIGTDGGGLNRYDRATETFTRYRHDPDNPKSLSHDVVLSIHEDRDGRLWIGTDGGGLNRFDRQTETFSHFTHQPNDPRSLSSNEVSFIYEDRSGVLWVGTEGDGLNRFDRQTEIFTHYQHHPKDLRSLSHNKLLTFYEDRGGVLWLGTNGGGLNKSNRTAATFAYYKHDPNDPHSLSDDMVFSLHEDRAGVLWIGTLEGGLNRLDRATDTFTHYQHDPDDSRSLSSNTVYVIYEDATGALWVGTEGDGLNRFDRDTETFTRYQHDPNDPKSLSSNNIFSLFMDQSGTLWVGTYGGGLNQFNPATETFTPYRHDPEDPHSLSDNRVNALYEDRSGHLWVGTEGGLNKFDRASERFTRYQHDHNDPGSLGNNDIMTVYEDHAGVLWVGTYGGGLNRFDRQTETFTRYLDQDGLPNNVVYGIVEDSLGFLWLSTNKGLAKFDPRTETFRNYDEHDGLQSNEFNSGAYGKGRQGELFFGGINGFNIFHPARIKDNPYVPPIVLTSFKTFNEEARLDTTISEISVITLDHDENVFSFEFATLSFTVPEKNQYAYKLEGFKDEWIDLGPKRDITFINLDAGSYTFRVKGSNNKGGGNEKEAALRITIKPPWWQMWWFRLSMLVGVALLLWGAYQVQIRSIRARNRALWAEITERKEVEERLEAFFSQSLDGCFFMMLDEPIAWNETVDKEHLLDYVFAHQRITQINDAMLAQYGATRETFLGRTPAQLFAYDIPHGRALWTTFLDTGRVHLETQERHTDGTPMWIEGEYVCLYDEQGRIKGHFGIQREITDRKHAEEEREQLIAQLEATNTELERFTYTVSHDLKSPIVTIKGFLGLLEQDVAAGDTQRMNQDIEHIHTAADKMYRLLAELLELSRIGRLINPPEAVSLTELVREAVALVAGQIIARGVEVDIAPEMPSVLGDRLRLLEVYQNLIDNAVKFMGKQPAPRLEIGTRQNDAEVICFVRDNGIGIEPLYHEKVFGLFERLEADGESTGIGLALVKRIVEVHGGRIWIESEGKGKGTTFFFTLPPNDQPDPTGTVG